MLAGMWRMGMPVDCWWECLLVQIVWKMMWWSSKYGKIEHSIWPSNPTTGCVVKGNNNGLLKNIHNPMFSVVFFTIGKTRHWPKHPLANDTTEPCAYHLILKWKLPCHLWTQRMQFWVKLVRHRKTNTMWFSYNPCGILKELCSWIWLLEAGVVGDGVCRRHWSKLYLDKRNKLRDLW